MAADTRFTRRLKNTRAGMSLLEMLLALALSVVVLAIVGNALHFHLHTFQTRRDGVEQAQVARAILQHIARDLRAAVSNESLDVKGLEALSLDPTQLAQTAGVNLPAGTLGSTTSGETGATGSKTGEEKEAEPPTETEPAFSVGFYGDTASLQFDMTRLPRLDEYDPRYSADGSGDVTRIPSDVRRVTYSRAGEFTAMNMTLPAESRLGSSPLPTPVSLEPRELLRSEQEVSLATSQLITSAPDQNKTLHEEPVADGVTRLQFLYFDGYEWWPDWNSDDRQGLPLAVEVILGLANESRSVSADAKMTSSFDTSAPTAETLYRLVVRIPVAEPLTAGQEEPAAEEEKTESSGSTGAAETKS